MGVCLYKGPWTHTEVLERRLLEYFGPQDFRVANANEIKKGALDFNEGRRPDLLVLPGGYSTALADQLGQDGFQRIRDYLHSGGRGLFICASAYSACNFIWHPEGYQRVAPLQGHGSHLTLNLFPNIEALGPLPAPDGENSAYGHGIETLSGYSGVGDVRTFYVSGPGFKVPRDSGAKILASYKRLVGTSAHSAAIVECTYGQGRVILAGPHIEYTTRDIVARLKGPRHVTMLNTPPLEGSFDVQPGAQFLANSSVRFRLGYNPDDPSLEVRGGFFNRVVGDLVHVGPRHAEESSTRQSSGFGSIGRRTLRSNIRFEGVRPAGPSDISAA